MGIVKKFICGAVFVVLFLSPCLAVSPKIKVKIMEKNPCYVHEKRNIKAKGIMIHSTAEPGIMAEDWYELWNIPLEEGGREVGVHAFVDDKNIVQYLPWDKRAWHCGRGPNGSCNDTHISIEMCEPASIKYRDPNTIDDSYDPKEPANKAYFNAALKNMVELCAYLAQQYRIDTNNIICHQEGHQRGLASDHVDISHWWPLHGLTMDIFRDLVRKELNNEPIKYDF